mgnify:FL=1
MEQWRFIDSGHADGFTNMAVDTALAHCYKGSPVLRLYGWRPPAISLGFHQRLQELDLAKCRHDGIDVVYRPTGGRAVLHADEVTYAVILGPGCRLYDERVMPVYERISQGIMAALALLQIPLVFERAPALKGAGGRNALSSLCFASSIQYEIGYGGKKMIGSAQRRFGTTVLQHGSILLGGAHLKLVDYLRPQKEGGGEEEWRGHARRFMQEKTVALNEISPSPLDYAGVVDALRRGFAANRGIIWSGAGLTEEEATLAAGLREEYKDKIAARGQSG